MQLTVGGVVCEYTAVAVIYNDGSHWWSDMMCHGHFRRTRPGGGKTLPADEAHAASTAASSMAGMGGGKHPLEPCGFASYRYDGLESDGQLRFCGYELTLTSDSKLISLVLYRRTSTADGCCSARSAP